MAGNYSACDNYDLLVQSILPSNQPRVVILVALSPLNVCINYNWFI